MDKVSDLKLTSLLTNNSFFNSLLSQYKEKIKMTSAFLDKKQFIEDEINRIKAFITPPTVSIGPGWQIIAQFDHSAYVKYSYDWLISGQDWSIEEILASAKSQYLQGRNIMDDEETFVKSIKHHLGVGAGYVLYNRFLNEELKRMDEEKSNSYIAILGNFLSNPWVVTIIGGLILTFFAKRFGWI